MSWYLRVLKQYAVFSGRARRAEYWMFQLINVIFFLVLVGIDAAAHLQFGPEKRHGVLSTVYALAVFVPTIAASARRLHDIGKSAWWVLLHWVPCVGPILLLVWHLREGEPAANAYGPNPKALGTSP